MASRPYPGLRPFRRDEAVCFFGREDQIDQMLDKLAETHFLAVLGTSGSGKSSLVRAGLLPALSYVGLSESSATDVAPYWSITELRPGNRPFQRLATALTRGTGMGQNCPTDTQGQAAYIAELEQDLRRGSHALNWLLGVRPLPAGERLLIWVIGVSER